MLPERLRGSFVFPIHPRHPVGPAGPIHESGTGTGGRGRPSPPAKIRYGKPRKCLACPLFLMLFGNLISFSRHVSGAS